MAALLEVSGLSVDLAKDGGIARAVDSVSFALGRGESLGLVGESGCGKTMTALAIMGLLPEPARASGSIRFDGEETARVDDATMARLRGRRTAMVFQEPMTALNPVRTIGDQIAEGARLHLGLGARAARAHAAGLMERVGLPPLRFSPGLYPHELSGGQRQRVVIAIALAAGPALLIADEPTTALDVTTQARILDLIVEVTDEQKMALLMISHDLGVIAEMTDRMLVMYAGTVVERGATADVFRMMAHPYTRALFEALPAGDGAPGGRLRTIPGQVPGPRSGPAAACPFAPRCGKVAPRCRAGVPPAIAVAPGHAAICFYPESPAAERAR